MKSLKGNYGFYISAGILGLAIVGSAFLYKREADKAKRLETEVTETRDRIAAGRIANIPTEEHRQHLEEQKVQVEKLYTQIVSQPLHWNYVPEQMSGLQFAGYMGSTLDMIQDAAAQNAILISDKAKYLGFEEYAKMPPGLDEDVLQLQREFSAAVDIARLLVASNVYSIDRMVRGDEARMQAGTPTTRMRMLLEEGLTTRRIRGFDFYDTVPFRVEFTCTYPSLAYFLNSLITPNKIGEGRFPRNFLVINDLKFTVKEDKRESERVTDSSLDRRRAVTYAVGRRGLSVTAADIPDDLPDAMALLDRYGEAAIAFFRRWRAMLPEEKEMYRLKLTIDGQFTPAEQEKARAKLARVQKQFDQRKKLPGRPPDYNVLEVNMFIDVVEFNDKLIAEIEPAPSKTAPPASSSSTATRVSRKE